MAQIKVQNFGPIKSGLVENDGLVDIRKITVFIGNQGTGKSSIAKLISMFSWLEKQLYRGSLDEKDVISRNRLVNIYCNYNNLKKYFRSGTEIEYRGSAYTMTYADSKLTINRSDNTPRKYVLPKIMYIPAERNFFSVIKKAEKVKGLPLMLLDFFKELERSQQELSETLDLPVGNVKLEFDQTSQNLILRGDNYKLNISEASSGFQSLVPAFLVSRNIALSINQNQGSSQSELSAEEQKRLTTEIQAIINDENLSKEVKKAALELLSSKYRNECFLNIVEELEQNLFPTSQRDILYKLLEFVNITAGNTLIMTTHSPYIIDYLTLAIKAQQILQTFDNLPKGEFLKTKLKNIVPLNSSIFPEDSIVYELTDSGEIRKLSTYEGLPSDENYLNSCLAETNRFFSDLLEIEEEILSSVV
ncbi:MULTISPECIES: AAA family ATPase [Cylindrospermopsis]|uniref:ATP-binding protein n=2 Tax=Cylindrospermopsis TaxID=77021 RepID=A0A7H0EY48_9CYAN|nr:MULTISPECIES: AAA family ATPase [Cylindrospermopsis]KRH96230.1 hypothetical protein ASL19_08525 [Cylindrospermopsis sp. CR12]MBU6346581.1 AAA family ATPase [Cyanobacteria bacterium REEB494]QNP28714.1 ATP-binding protein [Cylindrospermopsis curvispora GIHE-G1]UJL34249.1 ATP-binding protein [Cylindrospermopsis raciborskii Cr2010]